MIEVLKCRPDLLAVLDVASEEPPHEDSPLYTLPNVVLTPHIAGSVGQECRRMGQCMVEELARYLAGQPLQWPVTRKLAMRTRHRPISEIRLPRPHVLRQAFETDENRLTPPNSTPIAKATGSPLYLPERKLCR